MELRSFEEFRNEVMQRLKENESNWKSQAKTFEEYIANNDAENYIKSGYKDYTSSYQIKPNSHMTPDNYFNASVEPVIWNTEMS